MRYVIRPVTPEARSRIGQVRPVRSNFATAWGDTLALLDRELWNLGVRDSFVMQIDCEERDLRLDGELRANARTASPAVAIAFDTRKHGSMLFATGKFDRWQDNVRAIALGLEALRKVDRYGITQSDEQYRGWQALPPGTPMPAAKMTVEGAVQVLHDAAQWDAGPFDPLGNPSHLSAAWRLAVMNHHPDHGGDPTVFQEVTEARDMIRGAQ
jgi:hypothetical protein